MRLRKCFSQMSRLSALHSKSYLLAAMLCNECNKAENIPNCNVAACIPHAFAKMFLTNVEALGANAKKLPACGYALQWMQQSRKHSKLQCSRVHTSCVCENVPHKCRGSRRYMLKSYLLAAMLCNECNKPENTSDCNKSRICFNRYWQ